MYVHVHVAICLCMYVCMCMCSVRMCCIVFVLKMHDAVCMNVHTMQKEVITCIMYNYRNTIQFKLNTYHQLSLTYSLWMFTLHNLTVCNHGYVFPFSASTLTP